MQTLFTLLEHPLTDRIGWTLLHSVWLLAIVGVIVAGELFALRRHTAAVRYLAATTGLAVMALVPVTVYFNMTIDSPIARQVGNEFNRDGSIAALDSEPTTASLPAIFNAAGNGGADVAPSLATQFRSLLPGAVFLWACGVGLLSLRLIVMWRFVQRLRVRQTTPVSDAVRAAFERVCHRMGIQRPVELLQSALVSVPTVIGCLRPVILLPTSSLMGLDTRELEAILAHELAHVRRHDNLVNILQSIVEILLFFHPAVWWLSRRIRIERENCCDDMAVGIVGNKVAYARVLARIAELGSRPVGLAASANGSDLVARVRRLLIESPGDSSTTSKWIGGLVSLSLIGCLAMVITFSTHDSQAVAQTKTDDKAEAEEKTEPEIEKDDRPVEELTQAELAVLAAEYEQLCALSKETALLRIAPPFPKSRLAFYRVKSPGQADAIPAGPDNMFLHWKDDKVLTWGMSFAGGDGTNLRTAIRMLLRVYPQEIIWGDGLESLNITGDFVVNTKASQPRILARLEKLFNDQSEQKLSMKFRDKERDVYVAGGEFNFKPIDPDNKRIEIYGERLNTDPSRGGGGSGNVDKFLEWVGMWIEKPVLGELESPSKERVSWHYNLESSFNEEQRRQAKDPAIVLKHVTEQTGLKFKKEKRKLRTLIIERKK
ncbi:Regulatory protein BlaR1 [Symmachiella macrocystis]|uniref:Regulatory protein BlaR1 n=1 Tax=Symmachiella macrocystis TaxID=2527985 RepID=A0A5C6BKF6_9PLAN|nr:M56 family metallopeptidase [Symmachiella macrocystis]TWU12232.1 Regulatory protein BlaR1 [Symmachiella macrocystis]